MEGQQNIILCLLTSLLCQASVSSVGKDISHAVGYMILANLANLFQLTLWGSLKKDRKMAFPYLPSYVVMGFSWGSAVLTVNKSVLVCLGLYVIGLRSSLAVCQPGMQSSPFGSSFDEYMVLITGLRLCQEIKREESEKADGAVAAEDIDMELEGWEVVKKTEFRKG